MIKCMFCNCEVSLINPDWGRMMDTISQYSSGLNNVYSCSRCDAHFVPNKSPQGGMACYEFILDKYRVFASEQDNFTDVYEIQIWVYKDNMKQRNGSGFVPPSEPLTIYKKILSVRHIDFNCKEDLLNKIKTMVIFI